jgi:putative endonuclease
MIPPPPGGGATAQRESVVYMLQSLRDGTSYVGWTTNLSRRLVEHTSGLSPFSQRKRPWQLLGVERDSSPEAAEARERALKRSPRMLQLFQTRVLNGAAVGRPREVVG